MKITTSRFGRIDVQTDHIIRFPGGLLGFEECREWVLLADQQNDALAWLQSVERPTIALALVSPRRFVPDYQIRVARRELTSLHLRDLKRAEVLVILGKTDGSITLNLKAPLVINLDCRLGRQVITNGDLPVQYPLSSGKTALRRIA
jgi:flagellar assembly factor FliW